METRSKMTPHEIALRESLSTTTLEIREEETKSLSLGYSHRIFSNQRTIIDIEVNKCLRRLKASAN